MKMMPGLQFKMYPHNWAVLLALTLAIPIQFHVGGRAFAASTNVVASGLSFSPRSVTINVGDSVIWTGLEPGFHNAQTDADPFCGAPSGSLTTCTHTFNQAGTFNYYGITHRPPVLAGTVIVQPSANNP